jgi:hypothetical protein
MKNNVNPIKIARGDSIHASKHANRQTWVKRGQKNMK